MALRRLHSSHFAGPAIMVGIALIILSWPLAAALDAFFGAGGFLKQLSDPGTGKVVLRLLFMAIQLVFLLYITRIMGKYRQQGMQLKEALHGAEREKILAQGILEAVGDAISMQDLDLKILYQNQLHKELMGQHEGERCYQAYQHKDAVCPGCHLFLSFQDGESHRNEVSTPGGNFFEIISTPLRDPTGKIVAGIEAVRDITARKKAGMEIGKMNGELALRALELSSANRELETFSYSLSHDLRSYITCISLAQEVLLLRKGSHDPDLVQMVKPIEDSCRGMKALIEAMLTLSQLSRQEMRWELVPLSDLVQQVLLQLRQQEPERRVEVSVSPGITVKGDRQLLKIILENLVGNAWKYTLREPAPKIEFGVTERAGERCFFVRDNGAGFDMAKREKLFLPFERLHSAREFPGSGVGLATVQRAVQRHGGEVWGEGEPGKGACFSFTLEEHRGT
jgi:signal transduction histidine kinase